ncbi:hypothetical protein GZ78_29195 [Endozoicomonas numazuensis]|uniref:DUF4892 domain-containing protein n=2 Tax=Endozoicomonas numazuensis TaxID=1137799 RepID=A0A081MYF6_9GAMM|nr:hypothetical protein GZ78_29260 [Endozoicomonas numazuensis]KEQ11311.1 hypothetical protein GZ78_29195 [Endozoicomonas numazuensis]
MAIFHSFLRRTSSFMLASAFFLPATVFADEIAPFPNATLDLQLKQSVTSYPVISSSMKKVNGIVTADSEQWLDGSLDRKLYLLPSGKSSDEAYRFFTEQFKKLGVTPVFSCERFSCGGSNFWANNVFDIARLYGLDKEQAYFLGQKEVDGKTAYYLTYTVRRGNKREYALVDIFTAGKAKALKRNQVVLPTLPGSLSALASSDAYKALLKAFENQSRPLLITVESASAGRVSEVDSLSRQLQEIQTLLQSKLREDAISSSRYRIQSIVGDQGEGTLHWQVLQ